ncbi:hypothetical protein, partial [Serratia marcescens]|uniref:hypothetical protein n=1 Tax=Serratia marcescens TaxID=615 RepID=UPI001CAA88F2
LNDLTKKSAFFQPLSQCVSNPDCSYFNVLVNESFICFLYLSIFSLVAPQTSCATRAFEPEKLSWC